MKYERNYNTICKNIFPDLQNISTKKTSNKLVLHLKIFKNIVKLLNPTEY